MPGIQEIVITRIHDHHSNAIFAEAVRGESRPMSVSFYSNEPKKHVMSLNLENAMISGYSLSTGGDRPIESLSINFTKVKYSYEASK